MCNLLYFVPYLAILAQLLEDMFRDRLGSQLGRISLKQAVLLQPLQQLVRLPLLLLLLDPPQLLAALPGLRLHG